MGYSPDNESNKQAAALWYQAGGSSAAENTGNVNLDVFSDMKRIYVYNRETHTFERPFYNEELEAEYDPVTNPNPHFRLLDEKFNMDLFAPSDPENPLSPLKNDIYIFSPGAENLGKVHMIKGGGNYALSSSYKNIAGPENQGPTKEELDALTAEYRSTMNPYEKKIAGAYDHLRKFENSMNAYTMIYGVRQPSKEEIRSKKYPDVYETMLVTNERDRFDDAYKDHPIPEPDEEAIGKLTNEEFSMVAMTVLFTDEGGRYIQNGKSVQENLKYSLANSNQHIDTVAFSRPGYGFFEYSRSARKAAGDAAAAYTHGNTQPLGKLIAEGLNNLTIGREYTVRDGLFSRQSSAQMVYMHRVYQLLNDRPELMTAAKNAGLSEKSVQVLNMYETMHNADAANAKDTIDLMSGRITDENVLREKMESILIRGIMMQSLYTSSRQEANYTGDIATAQWTAAHPNPSLAEANNMNEEILELQHEIRRNRPMLKEEEWFINPEAMKKAEEELRNDPVTGALIQQAMDSCQNVEQMRDYINNSRFNAIADALSDANSLNAFREARKDLVTFNIQMDTLLSRNPSYSNVFEKMMEAARGADTYPAAGDALKTQLTNLRNAAQKYIEAKDKENIRRHHRKLDENEISNDDARDRYSYAKKAVRICDRHLEKLGLVLNDRGVPAAGDDRNAKVKSSELKNLASQLRHNPEFSIEKFAKYTILHNLKETHNEASYKRLTQRDLTDQAQARMNTEEMKLMKDLCSYMDLSMHNMMAVYKAIKEYAKDLRQERTMLPEQLKTISLSIEAGQKRYTHTTGIAEIDEQLQQIALIRLEKLKNEKLDEFAKELNAGAASVSVTETIKSANEGYIPDGDRNAVINGFNTNGTFLSTLAAAHMLHFKSDEEFSNTLDKIITGQIEPYEMKSAYETAYNVIKSGNELDHAALEQNPREFDNPESMARQTYASIMSKVLPALKDEMQKIFNAPGNHAATMQFDEKSTRKLLLISNMINDFTEHAGLHVEANHMSVSDLTAYNMHSSRDLNVNECRNEIINLMYAGKIISKALGSNNISKLSEAYNNPESGALAEVIGNQFFADHFSKTHITEAGTALNTFLNGNPEENDMAAAMNSLAGKMEPGRPLLEHPEVQSAQRLKTLLGELSSSREDLMTVMPYIADGSFAKAMKPEIGNDGKLQDVKVFANKEAVVKWATRKKDADLTEGRHMMGEMRKSYAKASAGADPSFRKDLDNGIEALDKLYTIGVIPPTGLMTAGSERSVQAGKLMKAYFKAEFMNERLSHNHNLSYEDASREFREFSERPEVAAKFTSPGMNDVRNFVIEKKSADLVREAAPAQPALNHNGPQLLN